MSYSPVTASRWYHNLITTFFCLIGLSFLNTALFVGFYKLYRKIKPQYAPHYRRFIAVAATWPVVLALPPLLIAASFARRPIESISVVLLFTALATTFFTLLAYSFIKRMQRKPEDLREKYATKVAIVYALVGLIFMACPFIPRAILN